jgi:hypothetical protein
MLKTEKQDGFPLMPEEYEVIIDEIQLEAWKEGIEDANKNLMRKDLTLYEKMYGGC